MQDATTHLQILRFRGIYGVLRPWAGFTASAPRPRVRSIFTTTTGAVARVMRTLASVAVPASGEPAGRRAIPVAISVARPTAVSVGATAIASAAVVSAVLYGPVPAPGGVAITIAVAFAVAVTVSVAALRIVLVRTRAAKEMPELSSHIAWAARAAAAPVVARLVPAATVTVPPVIIMTVSSRGLLASCRRW